MIVTKTIEWDMGHRVTNHHSKCRSLHGHRYKAEISLSGDLVNIEGDSSQGMVIDFGDIKKIATKYVHDPLDHSFMVWKKDKLLVEFFRKNPDLKCVAVPFIPTAENIAGWVFKELDSRFQDTFGTGLKLESVRLWETPSGSALCQREDIHGS